MSETVQLPYIAVDKNVQNEYGGYVWECRNNLEARKLACELNEAFLDGQAKAFSQINELFSAIKKAVKA